MEHDYCQTLLEDILSWKTTGFPSIHCASAGRFEGTEGDKSQQLDIYPKKILWVIPPLTLICHSFWHTVWKYLYIWYSAILSCILSDILSGIYSHILSGILCGIYTDILSGILSGIFLRSGMLSGILPDILFWHSIWHLFWQSFLAFYLVYLQRFFVIEVRRGTLWCGGTLWSGACGGGPAGDTLIGSLGWRSSGEHSNLELAVEVRRGAEEGGRKEEGGRRKEEGGGGQADKI